MSKSIIEITPQIAEVLAHNIRWQIITMLSKDETIYAKKIAEVLNISESKVHYHLTKLRNAGLIKQIGVRTVNQGRAKLFRPIANHYILSLNKGILNQGKTSFSKIFSKHFFKNGSFLGKIVVGSAEPHGKYDAISRDGYLAGELCWYIGNRLPLDRQHLIPNYVITDLDYQKYKNNKEMNLILIGGHITNTLTAHYNQILKSKFDTFFVENKIICGTKEFNQPSHGLIALFQNPEKQGYWILILAGVRGLGTKSAIYTIVTDCCDNFLDETEFLTIIEGISSDGTHISEVIKIVSKSASK
jgi:predicted transcriptional regulator